MSATSKFDTPHARMLRWARSSSNAATVWASGTSPRQCSRYRSRRSVERRSRLRLQAASTPRRRRVVRIHLAHDEHLGARAGDRFPDDLLRASLAVHLGGVDEPDAELEPEPERGDFAGALAAPLAHAPRPQSQRGHRRALRKRDMGLGHRARCLSIMRIVYLRSGRSCPAVTGATMVDYPTVASWRKFRKPLPYPCRAARRLVRGRVPARLPGYVRVARQRRGRARRRHRRRSRPPDDPRHAVHQGRALPGAHLFRSSACCIRYAAPARRAKADSSGSAWDEALGTIAERFKAHRLLARRSAGDRPLQLRGNDGAAAVRLDGPALFQQARCIATRPHDLRDRGQGGLHRHHRRGGRNRPGAVRERAPDPDLGIESDRLQPAPVEPGAGSEAARREARRDRSLPQPDRREMPRAPRAASGDRRRAGAGNDARADRATVCSTKTTSPTTRWDSSSFASASSSGRRSAPRR